MSNDRGMILSRTHTQAQSTQGYELPSRVPDPTHQCMAVQIQWNFCFCVLLYWTEAQKIIASMYQINERELYLFTYTSPLLHILNCVCVFCSVLCAKSTWSRLSSFSLNLSLSGKLFLGCVFLDLLHFVGQWEINVCSWTFAALPWMCVCVCWRERWPDLWAGAGVNECVSL